jgi:sigma-B regulation protein RsbU (phosphoserine phosphatase)
VGLEPDIEPFIDKARIHLDPGDVVVLYTDGITEARDEAGSFYGLERLCTVVQQHCHRSAQDIRQLVIEDVRQHIGSRFVNDDLTLLVLKQRA